ncbi:AAA family ATPase [Desulfogranum mediterraneum]|uniref:AAA family ATPase n=1 Tax=Desulfogranum mediterraneum TaxID=160661 RepID=UPI00040B10AB|nr:MoxR family ATPase [Desulfogranum mediterraneum]
MTFSRHKPSPDDRPAALSRLWAEILTEADHFILGKEEQFRLALCSLLAGGHLLIEDIPGIGKTTLAKVLAQILGLEFRRVQCTSDMLPGDILGVSIFEQQSGTFSFHPGPIFTQILLADEINRSPPKTQSALLEAMEEEQVSLEGTTRKLPAPFFVVATQNGLEQAGTYPLPESQLDRFLFRIAIGYPDRESERELLTRGGQLQSGRLPRRLLSPEQILELQQEVARVHLSPALIHYIQDLLDFSRQSGAFTLGLSPRAGLSLVQAGRAWALLQSRDYVLPEDIQELLPHVGGHRLRTADTLEEIPEQELRLLFQAVAVSV